MKAYRGPVGVVALGLMIGLAPHVVSLQLILLGSIAALALVCGAEFSVILSVFSLFFLAFFRRVLAGDMGRVESDPLVLLPAALILIAVVLSWTRRPTRQLTPVVSAVPIAMATVCAFSLALNPTLSISALYPSVLMIGLWLLLFVIQSGRVADVWPFIYRMLPTIGAVVATYGFFQFFYLPAWDRHWMIASKLMSIGRPFPEQVRVFSTIDSPGPFALLLGICVVVTYTKSFTTHGPLRYFLIVMGSYEFVALTISGVRTALVALVVTLLAVALFWLRGFARVLPIAIALVGYQLVGTIVGRFGGRSEVLSSSRITNLDVSRDVSVQTRFRMFARFPEALANPLGQGTSVDVRTGETYSLDNSLLDIAFRFGPIAMILLIAILVSAFSGVLHTKTTSSPTRIGLAACGIYVLVFTFAGNIFASGTGVIVVLVLGTLIRYSRPEIPATDSDKISPIRRRLDRL